MTVDIIALALAFAALVFSLAVGVYVVVSARRIQAEYDDADYDYLTKKALWIASRPNPFINSPDATHKHP